MEQSLFYQITAVLAVAGLIAMLVSYLKQPSIIAFILTGLIIGSIGQARLQQGGALESLGQIGITLLLFMVGLELDVKRLKQLGKVALFTGLGQIFFTSIAGFLIAKLLGFASVTAMYLALALTFSSTIIVVKLLGEKKDLQSLYGRIVVGFLIVQDFAALILLMILGGGLDSHEAGVFYSLMGWQYVLTMLVKVLVLVLLLIWISKKLFPRLINKFGGSDELLMIFSLAWALGLSAFMSLPAVGFSLEVGGFVAGLALANSQVHYEIAARVKSLRDFFLIIFFIVFGAKLAFTGLGALLLPALVFALYVSIGNPIIMMLIMSALGYSPRTAFFCAVTTAQVSEFSFVLLALGNRLGHVPNEVMGMLTLVGIITISISSYTILYTRQIYEKLEPILKYFDFKKMKAEQGLDIKPFKNHIILAGANRLGSRFLHSLSSEKHKLVIVDFDPQIHHLHKQDNREIICGDITDPFIQEQVNLPLAKLIISTIPDFKDNLALLAQIRQRVLSLGTKLPKLIFVAQNDAESRTLYEQGVDYVLSPHFVGGVHLSGILENSNGLKQLKKLKTKHLSLL